MIKIPEQVEENGATPLSAETYKGLTIQSYEGFSREAIRDLYYHSRPLTIITEKGEMFHAYLDDGLLISLDPKSEWITDPEKNRLVTDPKCIPDDLKRIWSEYRFILLGRHDDWLWVAREDKIHGCE